MKKQKKGKRTAAASKPSTKRSAKSSQVKKTTRTSPLNPLSPELAEVVGAKELSRGETMKKVWDYIKLHHLQDSQNKRQINPDDKLAKIFGSHEPIDMFKMTALISGHIGKSKKS